MNTMQWAGLLRKLPLMAAATSSHIVDLRLRQRTLGSISTKISNLNGLLASSIDNAGTGITYKYDADGKCIETKGPRTIIFCSYDIAETE